MGGRGSNPIHKFVGRGDIGGIDFNTGSFTTDAAWHDLDLSGIIPANAIAVELSIDIKDNLADQFAQIRPKGHGVLHAGYKQKTQVADIEIYNQPVIEINPAYPQTLEYRFTNTAWTLITVDVLSWRI